MEIFCGEDKKKMMPTKIFTCVSVFHIYFPILLKNIIAISSILVLTQSSYAKDPQKHHEFSLVIQDSKLISSEDTLRVKQGSLVEVTWISNESVELHLHGYDILINLDTNSPKTMKLIAKVAGRFPISIHGKVANNHYHSSLAYLEVYPD